MQCPGPGALGLCRACDLCHFILPLQNIIVYALWFIVDEVRTPIGSLGRFGSGEGDDDLAAHVIGQLPDQAPGLDVEAVDDVILGCD